MKTLRKKLINILPIFAFIVNNNQFLYAQYLIDNIHVNQNTISPTDKIIHVGFGNEKPVLLLLKNGKVTEEGRVLTNNNKIPEESLNTPLKRSLKFFRRAQSYKVKKNYNSIAVITCPGVENYYHWLLQMVPRLIILKYSKQKCNNFFIDLRYKYQDEWLTLLEIDKKKIISPSNSGFVKGKLLLVPEIPVCIMRGKGFPRWVKAELNKIITSVQHKYKVKCLKKIYVSRKKAKYRKIINEDEVTLFLKQHGFETISFEDYNVVEQALLIKNAEYIIMQHGSGLSNILFITNPKTKVFEICDLSGPDALYRRMSKDYGIQHQFIDMRKYNKNKELMTKLNDLKNVDMYIDTKLLNKILLNNNCL